MRIILIGYYGWHNLGDDLFVEQLSRTLLKNPRLKKLHILCQDCYYQNPDPRVVYLSDSELPRLKRLQLLIQADYVIWGGGSVDFGETPKKMLLMQKVSQWTGGQFQFWGVGLEKVKLGQSAEAIASTKLFRRSAFLYLRDPVSLDKVADLQLDPSRYRLGGDIALLDPELYDPWRKPVSSDLAQTNLAQNNPAQKKSIKHIGISGKFWWGQGRADFYGDQLRPWVEKHGATIHCLPAHSGSKSNDNRFHRKLSATLPTGSCIIHDWATYPEFLTRLQSMDVHISNRLHGAIAADLLGVPNLGIASESKITHYIQKSGMLPDLRLVDFMEPISEQRIQTVVDQYSRPDQFIAAESEAARQAIAQALR